jgi:hypothetical protein
LADAEIAGAVAMQARQIMQFGKALVGKEMAA